MFNIIKNFVDAVKNAPLWISIIAIVFWCGSSVRRCLF